MTRYEITELAPDAFRVQAMDDEGKDHTTIFLGGKAVERATWYANHMNGVHQWPVLFPSD